MKKICFIGHFPPPISGLTKAVDTLYNSTLSQEYVFEKINIGHNNKKILGYLIKIKKSKAELFYFTISQSRGGNLRDLLILHAIGNRPCVIHLHGGFYRTLLSGLPGWQKRENYKAISKVSGAIVLGPSLRWIFKGILPNEKIYTVPNCVDDEYLMDDGEFEEKIRLYDQRKIKHVLYLSNFIRSKGYIDVLRLAKLEKMRGGDRRFHFDFAGNFFDQNEEECFWSYIKREKLSDYVTYHGVVDGDKKRTLLKLSDYFVLLTRYQNEGQPISILEAMGNGMVIITTDHAGIPDQVIDKLNGIVVSKNKIDVRSIYKRMLNMDNYNDIAIKNRMDVMNKYKEKNYIDNMRSVFISVIDKSEAHI